MNGLFAFLICTPPRRRLPCPSSVHQHAGSRYFADACGSGMSIARYSALPFSLASWRSLPVPVPVPVPLLVLNVNGNGGRTANATTVTSTSTTPRYHATATTMTTNHYHANRCICYPHHHCHWHEYYRCCRCCHHHHHHHHQADEPLFVFTKWGFVCAASARCRVWDRSFKCATLYSLPYVGTTLPLRLSRDKGVPTGATFVPHNSNMRS